MFTKKTDPNALFQQKKKMNYGSDHFCDVFKIYRFAFMSLLSASKMIASTSNNV